MSRPLVFFVALLLLFSGAGVLWLAAKSSSPPAGTTVEADADFVPPEKTLDEFSFTDQLARDFGSKDLDGKIWMGSFFFADCPSICRQQNLEISKIHRRFADAGVQIVNITVAPDKDPPHKLLVYANSFDADHNSWKFLTGKDIQYVRQVGAEFFGLPAADETHTSEVVLFDRSGEMRGSFNVMEPKEFATLIVEVEKLLEQDSDEQTSSAAEGQEPSTPETVAVES